MLDTNFFPNTFSYRVVNLGWDCLGKVNPLRNGKILDWFKLKAFAEDKITVAEMMISLSDKVEKIVEKGENAGYQHFLLFPQCFQKPAISGSLKVWTV